MQPNKDDTEHPLVSVCLMTSDWGTNLQQGIDAVLRQIHWNWHLTIVHNVVRAEIDEILEKNRARYFDRIKVIKTSSDHAHETLATALLHSEGKYLSFMSPSDPMPQERLQKEVAYLEATKKAKAVCSVSEPGVDPHGVIAVGGNEVQYRLGDAGNVNLSMQMASGRSMMICSLVAADLLPMLAHAINPEQHTYQMVG